MNYKVERQLPASGQWDEVLLSPFNTKEKALGYYNKYNMYYPTEHSKYRITETKSNLITFHQRD